MLILRFHPRIIATIALVTNSLASKPTDAWITVHVPIIIETDQLSKSPTPEWEAFDALKGKCSKNFEHRLETILVFDGHPGECSVLQQDKIIDVKSKHKEIYNFKTSGWKHSGIWIGCQYSSTRINLCQQLPSSVKEVQITYSTAIPGKLIPIQVEFR